MLWSILVQGTSIHLAFFNCSIYDHRLACLVAGGIGQKRKEWDVYTGEGEARFLLFLQKAYSAHLEISYLQEVIYAQEDFTFPGSDYARRLPEGI